MALNIAKEVREMHKRTVRELRKQYADVFGEATNASNIDWLIKRIASRMQSNVEGDVSKRARNRALEVANNADLRMSPPPDSPKPKAQPRRTVSSKVVIKRRGHKTKKCRVVFGGVEKKKDVLEWRPTERVRYLNSEQDFEGAVFAAEVTNG